MKRKAKRKLLLHTCCAPCTTYVHRALLEEGFAVSGHFYNPNIHPYTEFDRRLTTMRLYSLERSLEMIYDDRYDIDSYFDAIYGKGDMRCLYCYLLRLHSTAKLAKARNFDCFSTTLLLSPHQKHELVGEAGRLVSKKIDIPFVYEDFRPHFGKSVEISRSMNLYRQKYCGCIFSEKERFKRDR